MMKTRNISNRLQRDRIVHSCCGSSLSQRDRRNADSMMGRRLSRKRKVLRREPKHLNGRSRQCRYAANIRKFPRSKEGGRYEVPINATALAPFKTLRERSDGIGPAIRRPRPLSKYSVGNGREVHSSQKWFEHCLEQAKIENFHWHDLRHTFASRLRRNGVGIEDIADLLDHEVPELRMTKRLHGDIEKLRAAVATLDLKTDTKTDTAPAVEFPKCKAV